LPRLFEREAIASTVHRYLHSPYRHLRPLDEIQSHRIWQLLSLESWLRQWQTRYGITLELR
jgi:asparagine synthase (glutamine-hydrolysing)